MESVKHEFIQDRRVSNMHRLGCCPFQLTTLAGKLYITSHAHAILRAHTQIIL